MTRWAAGVLWACTGAVTFTPGAWASCLPLPAPDLRELDAQAETQPAEAIRRINERMAAARGRQAELLRVQLLAVLADAYTEQSDLDEAQTTLTAARGELQGVDRSPDTERLQLRLDLLGDQLLIATSKSAEAVTATSKLLATLPADSLERACTLSVRSIAYDYLRQPDLAVGDALEVYRIARDGHWPNAKLEAAATLARTFSHAGLFPQAEQMISEVIAIAKADDRTELLSTAEYEQGMLLVKARRFAEARTAFERSRGDAMKIGDRFGVAAANSSLCWALIREGDLGAAETICNGGDADLAAGQREDLLTQLIGNRAHLDLEMHRPAAALEKLNSILTPKLHAMLPGSEPEFYFDRARALQALHRVNEANADLLHVHELEEAADNAQRNRQVAVLSAMIASDDLAAANRQLQTSMQLQQSEAARQRQERTTLSVSALVIAALLAYLLFISQRHGRDLRRLEVIMRSAGENAPDAFLLLDEQRRVRFANRDLCGYGPVPAIGQPISSAVPASMVPVLSAAIEEAFDRRTVVNFAMTVESEAAPARHFDMCVVPAIDRGQVVGGTLRAIDVTDHRELERGMVDGASHERQRLSGELHEGLGQQLAGILMLLGNASRAVRRGLPNAAQLIDEIARYVQEGIDATRELARNLAPVKIGMGSLTAAIKSLAVESQRRLRVNINADCRLGSLVLSDLAADHLYCICREAVTNGALHGRCSKVIILIEVEGNALKMSIADDGQGMPAGPGDSSGMGLKMMKYRTQLLGGDCQILAPADGGTCIVVKVPLVRIEAVAHA